MHFKVESNGSAIFVVRATTMHNPFFFSCLFVFFFFSFSFFNVQITADWNVSICQFL